MGVKITVPNEVGDEEEIQMCHPEQGKKLMGVIAAADGNMVGQIKRFEDKLEEWLVKIEDGNLPRKSAWTAFWGTIWRTLTYAIPATTMTRKECIALMKPFYLRLLSRLGVNRNMHRSWVFAHKDFQGLGMPDVYLEQTIAQLNYLESQTDVETPVASVLTACYEQLMLEVGTSTCLFQKTYDTEGFLATNCWLKSAWEGSSVYGIDVSLPFAAVLPHQREHDKLLMDLIFQQGLSESDMSAFNRVRLSLRVLSLADITTGDGREIRPLYRNIKALRKHTPATSTLMWPVERPTSADFGVWVTNMNTITRSDFRLHRQLGDWLMEPQQEPQWRYDLQNKRLFHRSGDTWDTYAPLPHVCTRGQRRRFTEIASNSALPDGTVPATATVLDTGAVEFSGAGRMAVPKISTVPFEESLHDGDDSWMWAETALETPSHILADGIATNEATLITDGSYYRDLAPTKGGACWILETHGNSTHQAAGCLRSTGTTATAYRSELSGIYGGSAQNSVESMEAYGS